MAQAHFYLTVGNDRLRLPLTPDNISVKKGTKAISFDVIKDGEHKIPRGMAVTGYSWNGTLPGKAMSDLGFVFDWQNPKDIIKKLNTWQEKGKIIEFMVTEAGIKDNVFIDSANYTYAGPGNVNYQLTLSSYRPLTVTNAPKQPKIKIPVEKPKPTPTTTPSSPSGGGSKPPQPQTPTNPTKPPLSVTIPTTTLTKPRVNAVVNTSPNRPNAGGLATHFISMAY